MIKVEERERIRRAYFIEEKSIREIAREFHRSRKTIRKALGTSEREGYKIIVPRTSPVLGPYQEEIEQLLSENETLPRKQRYTGHQIYKALGAKGYSGSESGVHVYLWKRRKESKKEKVFIPLEFDPGSDAQVDWGEGIAQIGGEEVKVELYVMRLCYSRKIFVMAFPTQKQEAFFAGHVKAFHHFEGVPHRITYDNLKTAVKRILEGRNRVEQESFIVFRSHYLFESNFCTPGEAHEKGRVEDGVGYALRNFMTPPPQVDSFEQLNRHLLSGCLEDDNRRVARQKTNIGEAWEHERPKLMGIPQRDYLCCVNVPARINRYSQVEFETNRYSVPVDEAYKNLVVRAYPFRLEVLHLDRVIASHPRCYGREQELIEPLHYLTLLEQRPGAFDHAKPIRRWREKWPEVYERLLLSLRSKWDHRGIREFIAILKLHRDYPADKIEAAVSLALGYGCVHFDGVRLCLNQLLHPDDGVSPLNLESYPKLIGVGEQPVDVKCYEQLLNPSWPQTILSPEAAKGERLP